MNNIITQHSVVVSKGVRDGVHPDMAHVELARGVGEHGQHITQHLEEEQAGRTLALASNTAQHCEVCQHRDASSALLLELLIAKIEAIRS